ncbi:MAG: hypothetical protein Q4D94_05540 [Bacillota bacterium]|nr:hypothetical protein [Bacillota bacterium]
MASIGGSGVVGVTDGMVSVCEDLQQQSVKIQNYIEELESLKSQLSNDWEGEDLDTLLTEFAGFKAKLDELPSVVKSISDWGLSTHEAYTEHAHKVSEAITSVLQ